MNPQHDGNRAIAWTRDELGRFVREAWVRWARTQPNPKPSWLVPYNELDESDKEADRQIGEAVARWTLLGDAAGHAMVDMVRELVAVPVEGVGSITELQRLIVKLSDGLTDEGGGWSIEGLHNARCSVAAAVPFDMLPEWLHPYAPPRSITPTPAEARAKRAEEDARRWREALEFYADPKNWTVDGPMFGVDSAMRPYCDNGARARVALTRPASSPPVESGE